MEDYKTLTITGGKHRGWSSGTMQKGQLEELEALAACLVGGKQWPICLEQQLQAKAMALAVESQL